MTNTQYRVRALIRDVRARWRRRALMQGTALSVGVLAVGGTVLLLMHGSVSPLVMGLGMAFVALAFLAALGQFVIRPAIRPITDRDVAMYVEERLPDLEDRLNAAVEIDNPEAARRAHGVLVDHLIDDVAERARTLPLTAIVARGRERVLMGVSACVLLLFLVLGYRSIDDIRASVAAGTLMPRTTPYMTVDPGDAEIEQGASQAVVVTLRDASATDVALHFRSGDQPWQRAAMQPAVGEPTYLHEFLDVQEPITYFVEHADRRTDTYDISLYRFPAVTQIDLTYSFPDYTGKAPEREMDGGDVRAVRGTIVSLDVATNGTAVEAELVLDDGTSIPLQAADDGRFRGRLTLDEPGYYSVRLTDGEDKRNKFPEEYRITPVDDLPPRVTVTIPQRDVRANAVEEVLVAARAEDDFGLRDFRLRFAVNGDPEQTISLSDDDVARALEADGEHLFFLEDYALEPGDVISYFVEAEDFSGNSPEASDMYFVEVIPFDQEYAQVAGGGGAQGGGQSGIVMSQQQIIAATWKLVRERDAMEAEDHATSRRALTQAQNNLRVEIAQRISETTFSVELQRSDASRAIVEELRAAIEAMEQAVDDLGADRLREALQPERTALNHLLKADAFNRERQIALNRGGQPGGSGGATEERMTELMDLELDISKDKYEIMQESSGGGGAAEMDETLRKLQDLARRQENLARQSQQPLEGEDQKRQVERLQRDQQDLQQQAEALADRIRQMSSENGSMTQQSEQQMDRASQRMQEAERALREGNVDQARASQQQAINELERIARDMQMASGQGQRRMIEEMDRSVDEMRAREEALERDLQQAVDQAAQGRIDTRELDRLAEQRRQVREDLQRIQEQAASLSGGSDADLAAAARELEREIRRRALDDQMRESEEALRRGWLDNARRRQDPIRDGLDGLDEAMEGFSGQIPVTEEENLARSLEAVRDLERELRALEEQATNGGTPAPDGRPAPGESEQSGSSASSGQSQAGNESTAPGQGGGNGADRAARADAARREARMERIREQLSRLEDQLRDSPNGQPLGGVRRALSRADNPNAPISGEEARAFFSDEVFAPLSQLEEALLQQLDRIAMERKLRGSRPDDVPAEYRELVARYYEALSRSGR